MTVRLCLVLALVMGALLVGCSGGGSEGNYTGKTEKFESADANKPMPEGKKGGPGMMATP